MGRETAMLGLVKLLGAIDQGRQVIGSGKKLKRLFHKSVEKYGSVTKKDREGAVWDVKVRYNSHRGKYLKFVQIVDGDEEDKFYAGATSNLKEPWKYKPMTDDEWEILAILADGRDCTDGIRDDEVQAVCNQLINEIIYERELEPEPD